MDWITVPQSAAHRYKDTDPQTYAVVGAAFAVHRELKHGFLESVYKDALSYEFELQAIPFQREAALLVSYKGITLASSFRADFFCFGAIVVECKAQQSVGKPEQAQVLNYLRITRQRRALLLNFGSPKLTIKRFVLDYPEHQRSQPSANPRAQNSPSDL